MATHKTALSELVEPLRIVAGANPTIYVATLHRIRQVEDVAESGELIALDLRGKRQRSFSFADEVMVAGKTFGPPWTLDAFAIDEHQGRRRIAVSGHHYVWSPSLVTLLDDDWRRTATFVHAGWIEYLHWVGTDRLLIGGFSDEHQGGMVAVLNPGAVDAGPLKMIVMRRSEVNAVSGARFNRAIVQVTPERIIVRTIEVPSTGLEAVDALYEFTPSLDLISASYSGRYWDTHRALELEGKLDHSRDRCPDRDGPPSIDVWEPSSGWTKKAVPPRQ